MVELSPILTLHLVRNSEKVTKLSDFLNFFQIFAILTLGKLIAIGQFVDAAVHFDLFSNIEIFNSVEFLITIGDWHSMASHDGP